MQSIVYKDISSGEMYVYKPKYSQQRSLFEEKRTERLINAINELSNMSNIVIYLYKKGKLRKIAEHKDNSIPYLKLTFTEV